MVVAVATTAAAAPAATVAGVALAGDILNIRKLDVMRSLLLLLGRKQRLVGTWSSNRRSKGISEIPTGRALRHGRVHSLAVLGQLQATAERADTTARGRLLGGAASDVADLVELTVDNRRGSDGHSDVDAVVVLAADACVTTVDWADGAGRLVRGFGMGDVAAGLVGAV